jgi:tetratricopeptide (TPR) repeat protein
MIYNKWGVIPFWVRPYVGLGYAYHETGQYRKEKKVYKKAEQDFPDSPGIIQRQAILALTEGDTAKANEYIEKFISIGKDNSVPEANITTGNAYIYSEAGILIKLRNIIDKHSHWHLKIRYG